MGAVKLAVDMENIARDNARRLWLAAWNIQSLDQAEWEMVRYEALDAAKMILNRDTIKAVPHDV